MLKNQSHKIAVSGSLAYDQIMDFPGVFGDHILPGQIHNLNVSFLIKDLRRSFGGTAGNIAYNLSLLDLKPIIFGVVGGDFSVYEKWLKKNGADLSRLSKTATGHTAAAYIITDQKDNQITAFYPGPNVKNYARRAASVGRFDLALIAPDDKQRMLEYAAIYKQKRTPYIFDPGQQLTAFSAAELRQAITGAKILIGNDYEIKLIQNKLKIVLKDLIKMVEILVMTKGGAGSEIYSSEDIRIKESVNEKKGVQETGNKKTGTEKMAVRKAGTAWKKIIVPPARPKNTSDPTGAGDAYRAGFIKGFLSGGDLKTCGQLAGLVAVYTVEKFGTQTHRFTMRELRKRYYENFREKLLLKEKAPDADGTA